MNRFSFAQYTYTIEGETRSLQDSNCFQYILQQLAAPTLLDPPRAEIPYRLMMTDGIRGKFIRHPDAKQPPIFLDMMVEEDATPFFEAISDCMFNVYGYVAHFGGANTYTGMSLFPIAQGGMRRQTSLENSSPPVSIVAAIQQAITKLHSESQSLINWQTRQDPFFYRAFQLQNATGEYVLFQQNNKLYVAKSDYLNTTPLVFHAV